MSNVPCPRDTISSSAFVHTDDDTPALSTFPEPTFALTSSYPETCARAREHLNAVRDRVTRMREYDAGNVFREAARVVNPFELTTHVAVRSLNRAHFKMHELVEEFGLLPTTGDVLSAHLCEGPGGFVECVKAWRYRFSRSRGEGDRWVGMTLTADASGVDFAASKAVDVAGRVLVGADGTGDVTRPDNVEHFVGHVASEGGAHIVTADGAFHIEGDMRNQQEESTAELVTAECAAALLSVREGGHFVLKIFDAFTAHTQRVLYVLARVFREVHVAKPYTSRMCNSERYVVCKGARAGHAADAGAACLRALRAWGREDGGNAGDADAAEIRFREAVVAHVASFAERQVSYLSEALEVSNQFERFGFVRPQSLRRVTQEIAGDPIAIELATGLCARLRVPMRAVARA